MIKEKFNVTGMTCSACSSHVDKAVCKLDGIDSVNVNLLNNNMIVSYDEKKLTANDIIKAVENSGYKASLFNQQKTTTNSAQDEFKEMKKRLIISFVFLIPLFYISMGHMMGLPLPSFLLGHKNAIAFAFTQFLLCLPIVYVNFKFFKNGFKSLFNGSPNMDSLIAIGSTASLIYGVYAIYKIGYGLGHNDISLVHSFSMDLYFESAGMILTLITLGKFFEARAKGKTSDAIAKLINLAPKTAVVLREGKEQEISVEEVLVDDIIIIKPGQGIPVDGIIIDGNSSIDESAITGESIPVEKNIGDKITSGTINKSGSFKMKATKVGDDTTLSQIIKLVEEASSSKAPISKLADKVSGVFVPIVIGISIIATIIWLLLGYSFEFALSIGISVLVISCPCALGLATPTAIMVATGKGAQNGILIKSAESLETLHEIDTVILDKTGTITNGKPIVTNIISFNNIDERSLLQIACSLEKSSEHPLAEAILNKALEESIEFKNVNSFNSISGMGITGVIDNITYFAGNLKLLKENNIPIEDIKEFGDELSKKGKTPLFFATDKNIIGIIAVMDTVKPTSKQAISELKAMGIKTVMLTGDNLNTATAIKNEVEIEEVIADVLPIQKEQHVRSFMEQGKKVCMVGDGINDSPALARADVGVAIGAGTDIAIESADVVLMKSDLLDAVSAIQLSKATIKNIKENLFWALFYNSLGIPLAAGVFFGVLGLKLNPMFAAAAMSCSSLFVVGNALRLKLFKPKYRNINNNIKQETRIENKGENEMKKVMKINGMACGHCSARVESVLNEIDGVSATVNLDEKIATITLTKEVDNNTLVKTVVDAGYEVVSIN